jgi:nucleoside-diphosphate-sugar epimerase
MKVLVTGAGGRIGRATVALLRGRDEQVVGLERVAADDLDVDALVVGDTSDGEAVRRALTGVDAVIHLAATPSPAGQDAQELFATNTRGTFTVLEEAGRAGISRVVIASSYSVTGLPWASQQHSPPFLPLDLTMPSVVEDPYGLSKQVDELTAAMMVRRFGLTAIALRYAYVGGLDDRLPERAAAFAEHPESGARELWSYVETRDAAAAAVQALTAPIGGFAALYIAAEETIAPYPTEALLARFHPASTLRRPIPGRATPIDLEPARTLLGFSAGHTLELAPRELA